MDPITITFTDAHDIAFIRSRVESGEFASEGEVVRGAVARLEEDNVDLERWLREVVVPRSEMAAAHPESLIPAEDILRRLDERFGKAQKIA